MKSTESWVLSGKIDSEEFWDQYEPTPPNQPLQPSQMYHEINQTYHKLQRQKSQVMLYTVISYSTYVYTVSLDPNIIFKVISESSYSDREDSQR